MKNLWNGVGTYLFWPLWPVLWVYFKISGVRSRLLVVSDGEVLLLKGWLGEKKYHLPGGGSKKNESIESSAVRELYEETGIAISESLLVSLGSRTFESKGLKYKARFYAVDLNERPDLRLPWYEIVGAKWVSIDEVDDYKLSKDALYALKRYSPLEQASLL